MMKIIFLTFAGFKINAYNMHIPRYNSIVCVSSNKGTK